jgi:hypothetical protein
MDLYTAGLWYNGPDRRILHKIAPHGASAPLSTYRAQLRLDLRNPTHPLGALLELPEVTLCASMSRQSQLDVFVEVMQAHGAALRGPRPLPEAYPTHCARHPACPHRAEIQSWCASCWEAIDEDLQADLGLAYRFGQHHDGDCHKWMTLAFKTPRP